MQFKRVGVSKDDQTFLLNNIPNGDQALDYCGYERNNVGVHNPVYRLPLTKEALNKIKNLPNVINVKLDNGLISGQTFPFEYTNWTRDNYGPIYIPRKGVIYSAPGQGPRVIDLAQFGQARVYLGRAKVPAGTYLGIECCLGADPGDLVLETEDGTVVDSQAIAGATGQAGNRQAIVQAAFPSGQEFPRGKPVLLGLVVDPGRFQAGKRAPEPGQTWKLDLAHAVQADRSCIAK